MRCTDAQFTQRKIPRLTEAHRGAMALQSAHISASQHWSITQGCLRKYPRRTFISFVQLVRGRGGGGGGGGGGEANHAWLTVARNNQQLFVHALMSLVCAHGEWSGFLRAIGLFLRPAMYNKDKGRLQNDASQVRASDHLTSMLVQHRRDRPSLCSPANHRQSPLIN